MANFHQFFNLWKTVLWDWLHPRKETDFYCFCQQSKKKEQFLQELFEVELFPTSCPQVFLALFAAPKDLTPTEMNSFLQCCMGEIQLVVKGSGKARDCLAQVRIPNHTHIAMQMCHNDPHLPWWWAPINPTKKRQGPQTPFCSNSRAPTLSGMAGSCSKHNTDPRLCMGTMNLFAT